MDKQSEGLKLLKEIRSISHMIETLQEQRDGIWAILTSTTIKPKEVDVQTSRAQDPMADRMIEILEYEEKLQEHQLELIRKRNIALEIIKQMDVKQQQLLILRYFKGHSIEKVGEEVKYSYRRAWTKVHEAEESFLELYEKMT